MQTALAPPPKFKAFYPGTGNPLSGGYLYSVQPGTNAAFGFNPAYPQPTYTDSTGITANPNPIILDSNGECNLWLSTFTKLVLYDPTGALIWSEDNVSANPLFLSASLPWITQSLPVAYVSATQFTVPGNQLSAYTPGTTIQATIAAGNVYGVVTNATYSAITSLTTVTVYWWGTQINSSLSAVALSITPAPLTAAGGLFPWTQPVMPVVSHTVSPTYSFLTTDLFQVHTWSATPNQNCILPSASNVPSGAWVTIKNLSSLALTYTALGGTIDGAAAPAGLAQYAAKKLMSDGSQWWSVI
jgi:hypothetical protein